MNEMIRTGEELAQWLFSFSRLSEHNFNRYRKQGINVTGKVRKEFLTGDYQGRYPINGHFYEVLFENLGGGVYKVTF